MGMFDFLNNNNPLKSLGPVNTMLNPLSTLTSNENTFGRGGSLNQIADPFGITKPENLKKGGPINRLLDPAGIFGGNKGMSQDQKMASMLTGGMSNIAGGTNNGNNLADSDFLGTSKNQRDNMINSLGTTPKPVFPGAIESYDPNSGRPDYPGSKSIWAGYNPRGGY